MNQSKVKLHLRSYDAAAKGDTATVRRRPQGTTWHLPDRRRLCGAYRGREEVLAFASEVIKLSGEAFRPARAGDRRSLAVRGVFGRAVQSLAAAATVLWTSAARRRWMMSAALSAVALLAASGAARASSGVYVTAEGIDSVGAYEVGEGGSLSSVFSAPTGHLPEGVAVSPDHSSIYVANYGDGTVSQLFAKESPAINAGRLPDALAVSPDGRSVYVTNSGDNTVSQYDVRKGGVLSPKAPATVNAGGGAVALAVSPDGQSVYVTNSADGTVSQYDVSARGLLSPKTPATASAGSGPGAIALTPDGRSVYVVDRGGTISQYDVGAGGALSAKTPATVAAGPYPTAIAVSPDGNSVYVTDEGSGGLGSGGSVSQYDIGAGGLLSPKDPANVATGSLPLGVALSPDGKRGYVTNSYDNTISEYDVGAGGALLPKNPPLETGMDPFAIVVWPDQGPSAAFAVNAVPAGSPTSFDGSASSDSDGTIARYDWNFGDGTTAANAGPRPTHTYGAPGSYTVTLTVTDDAGCSTVFIFTGQTASCNGTPSASTTRTASVSPAGPPVPVAGSPPPPPSAPLHAAFSFSPGGPICAPQTVTFDASASTPGAAPIRNWKWTFSGPPELTSSFGSYYYHGLFIVGWGTAEGYLPGPFVAVGEHALEDSGSEPPYLTTFRYEYHALTSSKAGAEPFAVAILGPIVTLTVENARGQTDSVTHVVPAAYPIVTFAGANTFGFPRCPHVQDHVTNVASLAADVGLTLAGNDTVGVPLDCAKTSKLCGGLVTLSTATGRGGVSARAARAMARAIVVGQERFALTPGRHATIKVALNQRGRALARQGRLRKMRVTVTTLHFGKGEGKSVSVVLAIKREAGPRVKRRGRP